MSTDFIREEIRRIIYERSGEEAIKDTSAKDEEPSGEKTTRLGRGGSYKKEIKQAGALATKKPRELMKRLNLSRASGSTDIDRLNSLLSQAVTGTPAMKDVYGNPEARRHKTSKKKGIRIPVKIIPARDARMYLIHTLVGALSAGYLDLKQDYQVEILGKDVLIYFSNKQYSWDKS